MIPNIILAGLALSAALAVACLIYVAWNAPDMDFD